MSKLKSPQTTEPNPADSAFQGKFWSVIAISVLALLAYTYLLSNLFTLEKTTAVYIKIVVNSGVLILSVTSFVLALRRQVDLALTNIFYATLILLISGPATTQGRTLFSTTTFLMIGIVIIGWLLPKPARRKNTVLLGVAYLIAWIFEWIAPSWRVVTGAAVVGPIVAAVFTLVVVILIGRNSWKNVKSFWTASIRNRLTTIILATAIIPVLLISGILGATTYTQVRAELIDTTFDRLDAVNEIKYAQLNSYINELDADMTSLSDTIGSLLSESLNKMEALNTLRRNQINQLFSTWDADVRDVASDPGVVTGMSDLAAGFQSQDAAYTRQLYLNNPELVNSGDETLYSTAHAEQHGFFAGYIDIHGYEDAYLIDLNGNIVYSVNKTDAFGTNLATGSYTESSLADLYRAILATPTQASYIADASEFGDVYTMFIGAPIYNNTTFVGILAYQLPMDVINEIMAERTGQGLTGESFLIAQKTDGSISYRSDRTSVGNTRFVRGTDITEIASRSMLKALGGEAGGGLIAASTGETRINAYSPMNIEGLNWAIFTSVNAVEALSPAHIEGEQDYLTLYQASYGYYDTFLIHPNGTIFFTVEQEADFGTNILTGEFSDSNLASLVSEVIESKDSEFTDFALYEPSGGAPAAFVATPVLNETGELALIVAAQLPIDDLNAIMNESHGVGETGESYIVGNDFLGRMDSRFIDQFGVETTVLNPDFAVDTKAVRTALAGEPGQEIIPDFRGVNVFSVWKPFQIDSPDETHPEGQIWAIITEIEESEALQPINELAGGLGLIIGLAALAIGALAVFLGTRFALGFVEPILNLTDTATAVAGGNLSLRIQSDSEDEIGTLTNTFNSMTAQLQDTLEGLEERVAARTKDLATVAQISTATATIRDPEEMLANMVQLTQRGFNRYHAHVFTYDEIADNLHIVACGWEEGSEYSGTHGTAAIQLSAEQSLVARAARTRRPVIVNDVQNEPGWLPNPQLPETRAEMAVPLVVGDDLLGVLDVQANTVDAFTEEDANIKMTLASQVATALQNAQAYKKAQSQAELESLSNVISQRIQRTTSIEETLQTAIRELGSAIGAKRVKANLRASFAEKPNTVPAEETVPLAEAGQRASETQNLSGPETPLVTDQE